MITGCHGMAAGEMLTCMLFILPTWGKKWCFQKHPQGRSPPMRILLWIIPVPSHLNLIGYWHFFNFYFKNYSILLLYFVPTRIVAYGIFMFPLWHNPIYRCGIAVVIGSQISWLVQISIDQLISMELYCIPEDMAQSLLWFTVFWIKQQFLNNPKLCSPSCSLSHRCFGVWRHFACL